MGQRADELRTEIEDTRTNLGETLDDIGDRVSPRRVMERRVDRARDRWTSVKESVMGRAEEMGNTASDKAGSTMESVQTSMHSMQESIEAAPRAVSRSTRGNPIAAGLIAFGVGALAAAMIPTTRMEDEAAESAASVLQPIGETLTESGRSVAEGVKEAATEHAQEVADTAQRAAEGVKGQAQDSVSEVRDTVSS